MTERPPLLPDGELDDDATFEIHPPDARKPVDYHPSDFSPPTQHRQEDSGCFSPQIVLPTCAAGCGVPVLLLLGSILFVILTGINTIDGIMDGIRGIFAPQPATATVTTSRTLVTSIQPLGQFVSISVELAKADIRVEVSEGFSNACGRTAYHVAQGAVEAGIDLMRLTEDDVTQDIISGEYTITLPAAQLTSCRIDYLNQYERSTSACGPSWESIRLLGNYTALQEFRDDAIEGGILQRAQDQAQVSLRSFLELATGQQVNIQFDTQQEVILPPSCMPDPPADWVYNPERNIWSN